MIRNEDELNRLTHAVIGCAMTVHNTLGNGFQEVIYQRALSLELFHNDISHVREKEMPIITGNNRLVQEEWTFSLKIL